jgi:hypothetical protein
MVFRARPCNIIITFFVFVYRHNITPSSARVETPYPTPFINNEMYTPDCWTYVKTDVFDIAPSSRRCSSDPPHPVNVIVRVCVSGIISIITLHPRRPKNDRLTRQRVSLHEIITNGRTVTGLASQR